MHFQSIRSRIAVAYLVLIALSMAGLTWYVLTFVRGSYVERLQRHMISDALLIAEVTKTTFLTGSDERADDLATRYATILGTRVTFIDGDGAVLGDSEADPDSMLNHLQRPEIAQARTSGLGYAERYSNTLEYDALYVAVPVTLGSSQQGYVRLAMPLVEIDKNIAALRGRILAATGLVLAIALVLGVWIAERTARPVRELTRTVRRIAGGDLSARMVPRSRDEVGQLTSDLSLMSDTLRTTIDDLERQRAEATAILQHMADGIVITDSQGRVRLMNEAAERILGTPAAEAVGRSLPQVAQDERIILAMRTCLSETSEQCELVEYAKGSRFLQIIATPIISEARETRCLMVLQDLSQVRRLESIRRDFVGNVSHELRTPIASLRALVDTLRGGAMDDPPAATRFLERMDTEINDLTGMVEELLQLSRIESGQASPQLAPVALKEIAAQVVERLQPQAERAQIALREDVPPNLPQMLADRDQIQTVLRNLVHNAIKFTPAGGQITVSATARDGFVAVSVTDTGIGVPAALHSRIFERFFKADPARTSGGTGLGLAIARHIVAAHGGDITVTSAQGPGSVFTFTVPIAL
ncbi:MAG: cell wall metabolism sensor histidine kinase WalK [Chloroflexi bacterium]|nr:cell wall metabolism sensor histidine kinase WalK [Chloroflexota bacterium]